MDISLDLVVEAARQRAAALTPEVAGYLVLLAAHELEDHPRRVSAETLSLNEAGEVRVPTALAVEAAAVEAELRALLGTLLSLSPTPSPSLSAVAERAGGAGLRPFIAELSSALIPINHAAARRALARLYRETSRARDGLRPSSAPLSATPLGATPVAALPVEVPPPVEALPVEVPPTEVPPVAVPPASSSAPRQEPEHTPEELAGTTPLLAVPASATPLGALTAAEVFAAVTPLAAPAANENASPLSSAAVTPSSRAPAFERPVPVEPFALARSDSREPTEPFARHAGPALVPLEPAPTSGEGPSVWIPEVAEAALESSPEPAPVETAAPREPAASAEAAELDIDVDLASEPPPAPVELAVLPPVAMRDLEPAPQPDVAYAAPPLAVLSSLEPDEELELVVPLIVEADDPDVTAPLLLREPRIEPRPINGLRSPLWSTYPDDDEDEPELELEDRRSDVADLLDRYLSETRSEALIAAGLRRMLGIDSPALSAPPH